MDRALVLFLWFGLPLGAFAVALIPRLPRWVSAIPSVVLLAVGVWETTTESPNYDMPWFGLMFFSFLAGVAAVLAAGGFATRESIRKRSPRLGACAALVVAGVYLLLVLYIASF